MSPTAAPERMPRGGCRNGSGKGFRPVLQLLRSRRAVVVSWLVGTGLAVVSAALALADGGGTFKPY